MKKTPRYRHADPVIIDMLSKWDEEAREWVRSILVEMAEPSPNPGFTAGDALIELDRRSDIPVGYARYIEAPFYDNRYQLVRTELERMERAGLLEKGTTVNSRGRERVLCYRRAPDRTWQVELEPDNPPVRQALEAWLAENEGSLGAIDSVMISRREIVARRGTAAA